jgi:hypothetical protein
MHAIFKKLFTNITVSKSACIGVVIASLFAACIYERENPFNPQDDNSYSVDLLDSIALTIDSIIPLVEELRGLSFSRPLKIAFKTYEQYRAEMDADSGWIEYEDYSDLWKRMLIQTGFIIRADNIGDIAEDQKGYYSSFPAAFYRPGTDSITIMSADENWVDIDTLRKEIWFRPMLAHEMLHALQDQALESFTENDAYTSDYYVAEDCLVEGDAMLLQYMFYFKYGSAYFADTWEYAAVDWAVSLADSFYNGINNGHFISPAFLEIPGVTPYYLGPSWVASQYALGGWSGINTLHGQIATLSMLQIMSGTDISPVDIPFDEFYPYVIAADYDFVIEDVLGALQLPMMLSLYDSQGMMGDNMRSMYGYSGDHMLFWHDSVTDVSSLIWAMAFENNSKASTVSEILSSLIKNDEDISERPAFTVTSADTADTGSLALTMFESGNSVTAVMVQNNLVWWLENFHDMDGLIQQIQQLQLAKKLRNGGTVHARNPIYPVLKKRRHGQFRNFKL